LAWLVTTKTARHTPERSPISVVTGLDAEKLIDVTNSVTTK